MLKNKSLKFKLMALCLMLNAIAALVAGAGVYGLDVATTDYGMIESASLPKTRELGNMLAEFRDIRVNLRSLGLPSMDAQQTAEAVKLAEASIQEYHHAEDLYAKHPITKEEYELYSTVKKDFATFEAVGAEVLGLHRKGDPASRAKIIELFLGACPRAADSYTRSITKLIEFQTVQAAEHSATARKTSSQMLALILILSLCGLAAGLGFGIPFSTSLSNAIRKVASDLSTGAGEVSAASLQISGSSHDLSAAATEQAAALQETVASIDEVSAMVSKNADNAKRSQDSARASAEAAQRGKKAVDQVILSIDEINVSNAQIVEQIERSNQEISDIVKVISDIGNKTKVINDIVFQTKLLSFNASVEAARAGEHGKGFAVVAEEVGNLAQMSGNAAKEISQMLEGSIQKVDKIVLDSRSKIEKMISSGKEKVSAGNLTARRCGDVLEEIVAHAGEVAHMVSEIATASREQAQGVQEITKAMSQMDVVTQQNSASSRQTAAAAQSLTAQSNALRGIVSTLTVAVEGKMSAGLRGPAREMARAVVPFTEKKARTTVSLQGRRTASGETIPDENDPRFHEP